MICLCFLGLPLAARLVDGLGNNTGVVEVFFNSTWTRICDDGLDESNAKVLCRQLGFDKALNLTEDSPVLANNLTKTSLNGSDLSCTGDETNIAYCNGTSAWDAVTMCKSAMYVSLACHEGEWVPVRYCLNNDCHDS